MIKEIIAAKKHLGQNFLHNKNILNTIVGDGDLSEKDIVEIGPGPGDLTECILSRNPKSLSVIEIDDDMIPRLRERFGKKIEIYHDDVLKINIISKNPPHNGATIVIPNSYQIYGNIPYYITSPILMHFLYGVEHLPESLTITMQKEVADRIMARDKKHSVLSIACRLMAEIKKICDIHPNNFSPVPKVWSTCLQLKILSANNREMNKRILLLARQGFAQKRKKLSSNLINAGYPNKLVGESFSWAGISGNIRAEDLTIQNWEKLAERLIQ